MDYEPKAYFAEHEYDNVNGFVIIGESSDHYHVAEKWQDDDKENTWVSYQILKSALATRVSDGKCEYSGKKVSDDQYEAICEKVGWDYPNGNTPAQKEAQE